MKRLLILAIILALNTSGMACEVPTDPDAHDPDKPVCVECCGYGCELCKDTGSPILAERTASHENN